MVKIRNASARLRELVMVQMDSTQLTTTRRFCHASFWGRRRIYRRPRRALFLQILDYGFGARVNLEFFEDAFHVTLHGPVADAELMGDFLDEIALT